MFSAITIFYSGIFLYRAPLYKWDGNAMAGEKNVSMSFRVSPRFKELLEAAAARENRSLTNMLETLLFVYCAQHGLSDIEDSLNAPNKNNIGIKR